MIEIIGESRMIGRDINILVGVCIVMHRRYEDFSTKLIPSLIRIFIQSPGSEENAKANKRRNILKLISELYISGVTDDIKHIGKCLRELVTSNKSFIILFIRLKLIESKRKTDSHFT